jgi:hypothetical protein
MTSSQRHQLLSCIDALCEGAASEDQLALLQQLVIADAEARQLYVAHMQLHGLLHWDVASVSTGELPGTAELPVRAPQPAEGSPARSDRVGWRRLAGAGLALGLMVLAIGSWSLLRHSADPQLAVDNTREVHAPAELETFRDPVPSLAIPPVRLSDGSGRNAPAPGEELLADGSLRGGDQSQSDQGDRSLVAVIDQALAAGWNEHGIQPAPPADDAEWHRRVMLDLTGRIPTAAEAEAFLKETAENKRQRRLSRLIESDEFARYFALQWTNLLVGRNPGEGLNRQALEGFLAREFAANRPWNELVIELISVTGSVEDHPAANFLVAHLENEAIPATAITARVLLGQQLQCAQCHQHPQVPDWQQSTFWSLNACFRQTRVQETLLVDQETGERRILRELVNQPGLEGSFFETLQGVVQVAYPRYQSHELELTPEADRRRWLAEQFVAGEVNDVARAFVNRVWSNLLGAGFSLRADDLGPHAQLSHPQLLEELSRRFVVSGYNVRELVRAICQCRAYQLRSSTSWNAAVDDPEHGQPLFSRAYYKRMTPEQMVHSLLIAAGASPAELYSGKGLERRQNWLAQFFQPDNTEENQECSTFDGSLPQTLTLLNGDLIQEVVQGGDATLASRIIDGTDSDVEKIRQLCLAALSRYPSVDELQSVRTQLRSYVRKRTERNVPPRQAAAEGFRDLYWAFLNSSEFSTIH